MTATPDRETETDFVVRAYDNVTVPRGTEPEEPPGLRHFVTCTVCFALIDASDGPGIGGRLARHDAWHYRNNNY